MAKITEGLADKLRVPDGARDAMVFCDELPGFFLRKFASGRASYGVKFNVGRQQRRKSLGKAVRGNLKAMRLEASAILAKARLGTDVVAIAKADAAKSNLTLAGTIPRYLAAREGELRRRSFSEVRRYLERSWAPLHGLSLEAIGRRDIVAALDVIEAASGKVSADRAKAALSALFGWAIDRGLAEVNPTLSVRSRASATGRARVLSESELCLVWRACADAGAFGKIVRLLLLTGQRRGEVGALRWSEVNFERAQLELPPERVKNGRGNIVPLCDEALAILGSMPRQGAHVFGRGAAGFATWGPSVAALRSRLPQAMPVWCLHDLRRSFVTNICELGVAPHIVECCINHVSGARSGIAAVYNKALHLAERRQAFALWGAHITALVSGRPGKVVPMKRARSAGAGAAE